MPRECFLSLSVEESASVQIRSDLSLSSRFHPFEELLRFQTSAYFCQSWALVMHVPSSPARKIAHGVSNGVQEAKGTPRRLTPFSRHHTTPRNHLRTPSAFTLPQP